MAKVQAAKEGPKKKIKKGKKKKNPKKTSEKYKKYKITDGKIERTARFCPRCGPGVFLLEADNRFYCGRCHLTEFKIKEKTEKKS